VKVATETITSKHNQKLQCLGIDSKLDNTLTCTSHEIEGRLEVRRKTAPEHHLTFTAESGENAGKYLTHRDIPHLGATGQILAKETLSVLKEYNSIDSICAILVDNTAVNTGHKGGMVAELEKLLGKKLHMIGCALHQNELPLRMLFTKLDGGSRGPQTFSGPIGKECSKDIHHQPQKHFEKISTSLVKYHFSPQTMKDLSNDQRLLLEYCLGIHHGEVKQPWASRKIGPLVHSRWLTLAIRLLCLYTRTGDPSKELKTLAQFICCVYAPAWFSIKPARLHHLPEILFATIGHLDSLEDEELQLCVHKNIQRNAFMLTPNNFIYSLLKSESVDDRKYGWEAIASIRSWGPTDQPSRVPQINFTASKWQELVNTQDLSIEPTATVTFGDDEIKDFRLTGAHLDFIDYPAHSQSVERAVKLVSWACKHVYGAARRHQVVSCALFCNEARPAFSSKSQYRNNVLECLET